MAERQERYDEKLVKILQDACGVFADKGYHHASVRDVASATGVSPAGLYYYFQSKEDLLFLIMDHCLGDLLLEVNAAVGHTSEPEERIRAIIRAHLGFLSRNGPEMRVLAQEWESLTGEYRRRILKRQREFAALVLRTLKALRPGIPRRVLRASAMGLFGMLTWTFQWYLPQRDLGIGELADHYSRVFLRGFLSGSGDGGPHGAGEGEPTGGTRPTKKPGSSTSLLPGPGF